MTSAKDERYNIFGSNGSTHLSVYFVKLRFVAISGVHRIYGFCRFRFFWKMIQQKSLEWSSGRGFLLPPRSTIQGSLSVSPKEEVVNKVLL